VVSCSHQVTRLPLLVVASTDSMVWGRWGMVIVGLRLPVGEAVPVVVVAVEIEGAGEVLVMGGVVAVGMVVVIVGVGMLVVAALVETASSLCSPHLPARTRTVPLRSPSNLPSHRAHLPPQI